MNQNAFAALSDDVRAQDSLDVKAGAKTPVKTSAKNSPKTPSPKKAEFKDDQSDARSDVQSEVHEEYDYTLTAEDQAVLAKADGYLAKWFAKDEYGESLADAHGGRWLERTSLRTSAWALLAAVDHTKRQLANGDRSQVPILVAVARTGQIELARAVLRADECLAFLDRPQRMFVREEDFNSRVHVGNGELHTPLKECSLWTLCKYNRGQICAGINACYERRLRDLPILPEVQAKPVKAKPSQAGAGARREREVPTSRAPEGATWNDRASSDFSVSIAEIAEPYNRALWGSVDLSHAFREAGIRRRAQYAEIRAQRQAEYEKKREERKIARETAPPKDIRPKVVPKPAVKPVVKPVASTSASASSSSGAPSTPSAPVVSAWKVPLVKPSQPVEPVADSAEASKSAEAPVSADSSEGKDKKGANRRARVRQEKASADDEGFTVVGKGRKTASKSKEGGRKGGRKDGRRPAGPLSQQSQQSE
ncbi:hypothetical protein YASMINEVIRUS_694 [Yasminevirus sp. GU-2018]|uniref:Uncharacterized protein n=1 Tax=Yasminevirus sp. GU-2018 TaxID=2420051 RepID=A0A5K0U9I4_9VIRU|nr:hypothetical protein YASMINEVIRUS_694 [Yasminevirus sp. GU-2018]